METNTNIPEAKQPASAGCHPTTCSVSYLQDLAEMWEECGRVCEMVKTAGWQDEKAAYLECARDLRQVIAGNLRSIEKMFSSQNSEIRSGIPAPVSTCSE